MELADFVADVSAHLTEGAENIEFFAPHLRALGETGFLTRYLEDHVARPDFQQSSYYSEPAIILAREAGRFEVRVCAWPADPAAEVYRDVNAHTHAFALLTYGYFGPGYWTSCYDCVPDELRRARIGESVILGPKRSLQLQAGTILYYPPFRVAHLQHPPDEYSISLNLIATPGNPHGYEQYFVNPVSRTRAASSTSDH